MANKKKKFGNPQKQRQHDELKKLDLELKSIKSKVVAILDSWIENYPIPNTRPYRYELNRAMTMLEYSRTTSTIPKSLNMLMTMKSCIITEIHVTSGYTGLKTYCEQIISGVLPGSETGKHQAKVMLAHLPVLERYNKTVDSGLIMVQGRKSKQSLQLLGIKTSPKANKNFYSA